MPRTRKPGFRAAHGALRKQGKLTTSETAVMDELITAKAPAPAGPDRTALGRFTAGNTVARRARHRADSDGALAKLEAKADPSWRAAHAWGRRYNRKRFSELAALHGALSAGVGAMLTTAANTLADSRWLRAKGAALGDTDLIRQAAQLGQQARAAERDAWQLAALGAESRAADEGDELTQRQRAFQKQLAEGGTK